MLVLLAFWLQIANPSYSNFNVFDADYVFEHDHYYAVEKYKSECELVKGVWYQNHLETKANIKGTRDYSSTIIQYSDKKCLKPNLNVIIVEKGDYTEVKTKKKKKLRKRPQEIQYITHRTILNRNLEPVKKPKDCFMDKKEYRTLQKDVKNKIRQVACYRRKSFKKLIVFNLSESKNRDTITLSRKISNGFFEKFIFKKQ